MFKFFSTEIDSLTQGSPMKMSHKMLSWTISLFFPWAL